MSISFMPPGADICGIAAQAPGSAAPLDQVRQFEAQLVNGPDAQEDDEAEDDEEGG
jgi:hypothetical protein